MAEIISIDKEGGWITIQDGPWTHEIPIAEYERMRAPAEGTRDALAEVVKLLPSVEEVKG